MAAILLATAECFKRGWAGLWVCFGLFGVTPGKYGRRAVRRVSATARCAGMLTQGETG